MNVALLFNSDHPTLGGWYGGSVLRLILGTKVLQAVNRNMRVSIGDILTFCAATGSGDPTLAHLIALCREVYRARQLDLLISDRLNTTHGKTTVFCWMFQNMTAQTARALHEQLTSNPAYLGAMDVDVSNPPQLALFRNSLVEEYRLRSNHCWIFYQMGENEDPGTGC